MTYESVTRPVLNRKQFLLAGLLAPLAASVPRRARAAERIRYALPAPAFLPAFTPINLAQIKGYYAEEGLEVDFQTVAGGTEVAKRVAAGEFDLGGGTGDTPILVRPRGMAVKTIAVLGGKSLTQIMTRRDSAIYSPENFRGKTITVVSNTDTTYFTLLGFLSSIGVRPDELKIVPAGPTGVYQMLIDGKADAMAGVPDWVVPVQRSGIKTMVFRSDEFFPSMAQAMISADQTIAARPKALRAFVRATLRGLADTIAAPDAAAAAITAKFPQHKGKEELVRDIVRYYASFVYPGQRTPGEINTFRMQKVQTFYRERNIVERDTPLKDLSTDQFLTG
ncbi:MULTISPECIES: ABC transporter substrate-binding protein [Polaromonas]|uniref:ABC transporter substrate-binding protein n=1 Tax=Polaromonas aquatica TaxID=332657 RepID=A0ABW1TZS4_9BURK